MIEFRTRKELKDFIWNYPGELRVTLQGEVYDNNKLIGKMNESKD